jgi:hypothetical protein
LDGLPTAGTSFPGTVSGNPLSSHSPIDYTLLLSYTFVQGTPLTPGSFEIGGRVTESDPPNSAFAVDLIGGDIGNSGGIPLYNPGNPSQSFFVPNDSGDGFGDPTWSTNAGAPPLLAGNYIDIDLGHLEVTQFLQYVDANYGPGTYDGELDYSLIAQDDATGNQLPIITPGPPTIDISVTITPNTPPPTTPEPGAVAMLAGMAVSGAAFLLRHRRR